MREAEEQSQRKILVSNPGKQYTHQLLRALQVNKYSFLFYTSFWFKPGRFPFNLIKLLPGKTRIKIESELRKRYFDKIPGSLVRQNPYFEIIRELSEKIVGSRFSERMQFIRDRIHDRWVASRLPSDYSMVIGYEESCKLTFQKAKKKGICTVLDLAQIHYKDIQTLAMRHPALGSLFVNQKLRREINRIKEKELNLADYIICLSGLAKKSLIENGIPEDKIFEVNLGFDPENFIQKNFFSPSGKLKIIYAGTITRRKGIDILLEAHKSLKDKIELTLVGPMADAEDLLKAHAEPITYFPYVEHARLNELFSLADIFVFPSYLDSWGMVVIEAMACGLPVIISTNTGAKDAVSSDAGFCIPPGDIESLKERILYFYTNRDQVKRMGENARKAALNYNWENYYTQIGRVINRINERG